MSGDGKVFGIGLSKTGTTSLTKALNILGIRSIHFPHDEVTLRELQRGEYRLSILREYQGVSDTPVAPFFAQLDRAWPGSRFILTVRDKASWLRSVEDHWEVILAKRRANDPSFRAFCDFINACVYGCIEFNAERFSYAYDTHVRHVQEYFAQRPDDLLVLDICAGRAGWDDLCRFLGTAVPADKPFPHEYRSSEVWAHIVHAASRDLAGVVPAGETVIVIDQQALGEEFADGRRRLPFLEQDGVYWGLPANDEQAIGELERQRNEAGASFLAVAWPAFWWFNNYARFTAHLQSKYSCVLRNERVAVWSLR